MAKNKKPPVTKVFQIEIGLVDGSFEACFLTGNRSVSEVRMFGFSNWIFNSTKMGCFKNTNDSISNQVLIELIRWFARSASFYPCVPGDFSVVLFNL